MDLLRLPLEILELILALPPNWHSFRKRRRWLEKRLVCKLFDSIISRQAFLKLDFRHLEAIKRVTSIPSPMRVFRYIKKETMAWLLHQKILLGHLHGSMLSAKRINLNQGSSVDDDSSFTYDEVKSACALAVAHMGTLRVSEGLETECPKALYQQLIRSRLAVAAYLNNEELIMSLISKGADVNASEEWFGPPLNAAAYSSRFSLVKLSIEHGADPNVPNYLGELIMVAVRERNKPLLRVLLSSDRLDPNTRDKHGYYPLSIACSSGALDTVHLILKHNRTDPNVISFFGTPIATAASLGHKHIVKLLMERDDVNIGLGDKSNWPLTRAADNGHGDVVEILLDKLAKDSDEYLRF